MLQKNSKSFLILQGSYSRFTRMLGETLRNRGHEITKIHFYGGDRYFWGGNWRALDFRGRTEELPGFYKDIFLSRGITDIILFGDCRPVHIPAIKLAEQLGIDYYVLEEGYLRPHWITLEWGGMAGNSCLPTFPDWYREYSKRLPPPAHEEIGDAMQSRVVNDLINTAAYYSLLPWYARYRTHRPYGPAYEYAFWIKRLASRAADRKYAANVTARLIANKEKYFVYPLQLDEDMQIRIHSPFGGTVPAIEAVIRSFALHAPTGTKLLIKNHPLDNGIIDYKKAIQETAARYDVLSRILYIDGGDLKMLKKHALGVVLVNSTSGLAALGSGHPVIALGKAIYDLPGLTFQGKLDDFWKSDFQTDRQLLLDFQTVLFNDILVNGNFYTEHGIALAIANSLPRLELPGCPYGSPPASSWRNAPMPQRVPVPNTKPALHNNNAPAAAIEPKLKQS
jgi:capsular polysaccharide export protein